VKNIFVEAIKSGNVSPDEFKYERLLEFTSTEWREVQAYLSQNYYYPEHEGLDLDFTNAITYSLQELFSSNPGASIQWKIGLAGTASKIPYPSWSGSGFWSEKLSDIEHEINFVSEELIPLVRNESWDEIIESLDLLSDIGLSLVIAHCQVRTFPQRDYFRSFLQSAELNDSYPMSQFVAHILSRSKDRASVERGDVILEDFYESIPATVSIDARMALVIWVEDFYNIMPPWWTDMLDWQMAASSWRDAAETKNIFLSGDNVEYELSAKLIRNSLQTFDSEDDDEEESNDGPIYSILAWLDGQKPQPKTSHFNRAEILAGLWINERDNEDLADYMDYNDLGLPLAYALAEGIITTNPKVEEHINDSFNMLLKVLEIEDTGFISYRELLRASE
jgi:hypothetical protein